MINNYLSDFKSENKKIAMYLRDRRKQDTVYAQTSNGKAVPLHECRLSDVEYIAGMWRVQNKFDYTIENVRGKNFVIGKKLPYTERTLFDFYEAYAVYENCYGKYKTSKPEYIVAKYVTNRGTFCAYGKTREDARAYLGIKLYDEFQDVIHVAINTQKQK